jgi:hypothetical protein
MNAEKKGREIYPTKDWMNLYVRKDRRTGTTKKTLAGLLILAVLLILCKAGIYDVMAQARDLRQEYGDNVKQLEAYEEQLADYDDVLQQYSRYAATAEEEAQEDRMEILQLVDRAVGSTAQVERISIAGGQVLVQFSGVTLQQSAEIVRKLENSDLVADTTVDTAFTTESKSSTVRANILIDLVKQPTEGGEAQ